ncbi:MAG: bifunctional folylpolyglutamate synthase/dihydrofolate synthase, partial [Paraperlucidibaca sp.]
MTKLNDWLAVLEQRHPSAIDLGLERVGVVADRLHLREFSCPVITVAGTNGKGSTVATIVAIARAAGWRVASYTSPHLVHFHERISCAGVLITDTDLVAALDAIDAVRADTSLTYFEHTTLAALWWFQRQNPDLIVLEVGLGGRLDAV